MLTREDNELLCRIGPETAMGRMMRRYWLPAAMSSELEADGAPKRVRLLGEDLVAFRDSSGRVGLLEELCPHRGVSLTLARNEDCGLRCLYHGWKFDVTGKILDMPTEAEPENFIDRFRAVAYPVREAGGIAWAYLGPAGTEPPPPDFEFTTFADERNVIVKARIDCNWVQCLEGVIDSAHANYLHADTFQPAPGLANSIYRDESLVVGRPSSDGKPRFDVEDTGYGFRYAAIRKPIADPDEKIFIRTTLFVAPFHGIFAGQAGWASHQAFVPIDDEHTMLYFVRTNLTRPVDDAERLRHAAWSGFLPGVDIDGEFRKQRSRDNDWQQDRAAMQTGASFSGIKGVQMEDAVVQESMGRLYDRSKEHLGTSDIAVVRMRRMMLQSVRDFAAGTAPPLGLAAPVDYRNLRATEGIIPIGMPWQSLDARAG